MILNVDTESKNIIATVQHNDWVEKYICTISACENPVCTCGIIDLDMTPLRAVDVNEDHLATHRIEIDIYKQSLANRDKKKNSKEEFQFAELFFNRLDENDLQILYEKYFTFKNKITESVGPDSIEAQFEYDEVEQNGFMSAYNDVLPYGDNMFVTINDTKCMILDQYCLLPECPCSDTILNFMPIKLVGKTGEELFSVWVNYKKKKWYDLEGRSVPFTAETLKSVMEEQDPDIYKRLLKRHIRLKIIYAHCKKKHFASSLPLQLPKVGRNDPCPCGSGKKYKKCCLMKSI